MQKNMPLKNNEINDALQNMWDTAKLAVDKVKQSNKKVNELQTQFDFLQNTINRKNIDIDLLHKKVNEIEKTINEKNERIASQYAEIDSFIKRQEKYSELETSYFTAINENQNLKTELENSIIKENDLNEKSNALNDLSKKYDKLLKEYVVVNEAISKAKAELKDYETTKKELINNRLEIINKNEQIEKLNVQLAEKNNIVLNQNQKIADGDKLCSELKEQNEFLNKELSKIKAEFEEKTSEFDLEKMDLIAKRLAVEEEVRNSFFSKQFLENILTVKEKEVETLKFVTEENENIKNKISEIHNNYHKKILSLETEIEALNNTNKINTDSLTAEIQKVSAEKENLIEKIKLLTAENGDLVEKNKTIREELVTQNKKVEDIKSKFINISENFAQIEKNESELEIEKTKLLDLVTVLTDELEKSKVENEISNKENSEIIKENKLLQKEIQKINKITTAFENLKQINSEQIQTINDLKKELEYYKKRVYDDDSLFAPENLNLLGAEELKYKKKIDSLNIEIAKLIKHNRELLNEMSSLQVKNASEEKNITENSTSNTVTAEKETKKENKKNNTQQDVLVDKLDSFISKLEKKI